MQLDVLTGFLSLPSALSQVVGMWASSAEAEPARPLLCLSMHPCICMPVQSAPTDLWVIRFLNSLKKNSQHPSL